MKNLLRGRKLSAREEKAFMAALHVRGEDVLEKDHRVFNLQALQGDIWAHQEKLKQHLTAAGVIFASREEASITLYETMGNVERDVAHSGVACLPRSTVERIFADKALR